MDSFAPRTISSLPGSAFPVFRFAAMTALLLAAFRHAPASMIDPLNSATAHVLAWSLGTAGMESVVRGASVHAGGLTVKVISECTALFACAPFLAFLFCLPATFRQRVLGFVLGIPALFAANTVRLALVLLAGALAPTLFPYAHAYLGHVFMAGAVLLVSFAWAEPAWKIRGFLGRFALFSGGFFAVWSLLNRPFVMILDRMIGAGFSLWGETLVFPHGHAAYYQTLGFVAYGGLVLATREFSAGFRVRALAWGFGAFAMIQLLFRLANVLMTAYGMPGARGASILFHLAANYFFPFCFWAGVKTFRARHPQG